MRRGSWPASAHPAGIITAASATCTSTPASTATHVQHATTLFQFLSRLAADFSAEALAAVSSSEPCACLTEGAPSHRPPSSEALAAPASSAASDAGSASVAGISRVTGLPGTSVAGASAALPPSLEVLLGAGGVGSGRVLGLAPQHDAKVRWPLGHSNCAYALVAPTWMLSNAATSLAALLHPADEHPFL